MFQRLHVLPVPCRYGEKMVKGSPYPRSYYKCSQSGCARRLLRAGHQQRACGKHCACISTQQPCSAWGRGAAASPRLTPDQWLLPAALDGFTGAARRRSWRRTRTGARWGWRTRWALLQLSARVWASVCTLCPGAAPPVWSAFEVGRAGAAAAPPRGSCAPWHGLASMQRLQRALSISTQNPTGTLEHCCMRSGRSG